MSIRFGRLHNVVESSPDHDIANYMFPGIGGIGFLLIGWLLVKKGVARRSLTARAFGRVPLNV